MWGSCFSVFIFLCFVSCTIILSIYVCLCPECYWGFFLFCTPVTWCYQLSMFNIAMSAWGLASQVQSTFFLKMTGTKSGIWQLLSNSSFLFIRCISLIVDVFLSVLVCSQDLISLNQSMTIEQRYTTVAFVCPWDYQFIFMSLNVPWYLSPLFLKLVLFARCSQEYGSCYQIVRFCFPLFSSYSWCVSIGFSL